MRVKHGDLWCMTKQGELIVPRPNAMSHTEGNQMAAKSDKNAPCQSEVIISH